MSIKNTEIMQFARLGYHSPEDTISWYWNFERECLMEDPQSGDTLAQFIVRELNDVYDPEADTVDQIEEALRAMRSAVLQLEQVCSVLRNRAQTARVLSGMPPL